MGGGGRQTNKELGKLDSRLAGALRKHIVLLRGGGGGGCVVTRAGCVLGTNVYID